MKYDKDIRYCRRAMTVIGLLQLPGIVTVLIGHAYGLAAVCAIWVYACFVVRRSMDVQQKTRDSQRLITATLDGRLAEEIENGTWRPSTHMTPMEEYDAERAFQKMADNAAEALDALEKDRQSQSYVCPKCGKVSFHPKDLLHRYCAACHEFERSDWRG